MAKIESYPLPEERVSFGDPDDPAGAPSAAGAARPQCNFEARKYSSLWLQICARRKEATLGPKIEGAWSAANVIAEHAPWLFESVTEEYAVAILMNSEHRVVGLTEVGRGTINASLVDLAGAFRAALLAGAVAVVLVHNHPSGNVKLSRDDEQVFFTAQRMAETVASVRVLDFLAVGRDPNAPSKGLFDGSRGEHGSIDLTGGAKRSPRSSRGSARLGATGASGARNVGFLDGQFQAVRDVGDTVSVEEVEGLDTEEALERQAQERLEGAQRAPSSFIGGDDVEGYWRGYLAGAINGLRAARAELLDGGRERFDGAVDGIDGTVLPFPKQPRKRGSRGARGEPARVLPIRPPARKTLPDLVREAAEEAGFGHRADELIGAMSGGLPPGADSELRELFWRVVRTVMPGGPRFSGAEGAEGAVGAPGRVSMTYGTLPDREVIAERMGGEPYTYELRGSDAEMAEGLEIPVEGSFDAHELHDTLTELAGAWSDGNEQAGDLASSILETLGIEWI